jgi:hypothetical protein
VLDLTAKQSHVYILAILNLSMAGNNVQEVKVKLGPLWTIGAIIWIVIGLAILAMMLFGTLALISVLPKISSALSTVSTLSSLGGSGGAGGNYGGSGNNGTNGTNPPQFNTENYLINLAMQMHSAVDQGNWSAASGDMAVIEAALSQVPPSELPSGMAQEVSALNQSIASRNATAFNNIYNQLSQSITG